MTTVAARPTSTLQLSDHRTAANFATAQAKSLSSVGVDALTTSQPGGGIVLAPSSAVSTTPQKFITVAAAESLNAVDRFLAGRSQAGVTLVSSIACNQVGSLAALASGGTGPRPTALREEDHLRSLVAHQKEQMEFLLKNSDQSNPVLYTNCYRKAPSVPIVQAHQGPSFHSSHATVDINNYPTRTAALSVAMADLTVHRGHKLRMPYLDPVKSIRDKMIRLERSLSSACLLDITWGTEDNAADYYFGSWKKKVEHTRSIRELSLLLVGLIDACCFRAFVPQWYKPQDNSEGSGALSSSLAENDDNHSNSFKVVAEDDGWSPNKESIRRKRVRCRENEILRLFGGELERVFNRGAPPTKRGKKVMRQETSMRRTNPEKESLEVTFEMSASNSCDQLKTQGPSERPDAKQASLSDPAKMPTNDENDRSAVNGSKSEAKLTKKTPPQNDAGKGLASNPELTPSNDQSKARLSTPKPVTEGSKVAKDVATPSTSSAKVSPDGPPSAEKVAECKTPSKTKSSKKRRAKRESSAAPPSSRRRSDRLHFVRHQVESLLGISDADENLSTVERAIVELKLDKLEKVLSNDDKTAGYWAVAGKKLFEPGGKLPVNTVRWLARHAGSARAPSVSYDTSYEVGEMSICHRWRKRTMACTTYEGLLYNLRFLDAHVDQAVAIAAGKIASRKSNVQQSSSASAIRCAHKDPATGFSEYFVAHGGGSGKLRGCWTSEETVDLACLVRYRLERRTSYAEKKKRLDQERKLKELKYSAAGIDRRAPPSSVKTVPSKTVPPRSNSVKSVPEQASLVKTKPSQTSSVAKRPSPTSAAKTNPHSINSVKTKSSQISSVTKKSPQTTSVKTQPSQVSSAKPKPLQTSSVKRKPYVKKAKTVGAGTDAKERLRKEKEMQLHASLSKHRDDTMRLLKASAAKGEASVPPNKMAAARSRNLKSMRIANTSMHQFGGKELTETELTTRMANAEAEAVQLYVKEIQGERARNLTQARTKPTSNAQKANKKPKASSGQAAAKTSLHSSPTKETQPALSSSPPKSSLQQSHTKPPHQSK
ncbi:hypothetical protein ACHAWF_017049 [Thalassiosira exigua]